MVLVAIALLAPLFAVVTRMIKEFPVFHATSDTNWWLGQLHSPDPSNREAGARNLGFNYGHGVHSVPDTEIKVAIPALLTALRDSEPRVRRAAALSLQWIAFGANERATVLPETRAIAMGLLATLCDEDPNIRVPSALALAGIYFQPFGESRPQPPLPDDVDGFLNAVAGATGDSERNVREWAFQVLQATAPRSKRHAPARLLAALGSVDATVRVRAAETVVMFPRGIDSALPALLRMVEADSDLGVRHSCFMSLASVRPSGASIPVLCEKLRSHARPARFRAADLLSRIGPAASEAVPLLLPLCDERFDPKTPFELQHPDWHDPAVAATWALGSIAPGTSMAGMAQASLTALLGSEHPWRRANAAKALRRFSDHDWQDTAGQAK
jgi:HEAT repeat protein